MTQLRLPPTHTPTPLKMTNFDHSIDEGLDETLRNEEVYGKYYAWNFQGLVWFDNNQFHAEVWVYKAYVDTISAKTLPQLMKKICKKYESY